MHSPSLTQTLAAMVDHEQVANVRDTQLRM